MGFINNVNVDVRGANHIAPCTYKTVVLKQNITKQNLNVLTQFMLNEYGKNTKFVIKWDYVLVDDITIPANCVLEFDGGSISGEYMIEFNNCYLSGNPILNVSTISGSILNNNIHTDWFNGCPNYIKLVFTIAEGKTVIFPSNGVIDIDYSFIIPSNCIVEGNNCKINILNTSDYIYESTRISNEGFTKDVLNKNITIRNLHFLVDKDNSGCRLMSFFKIENLVIDGCTFYAEESTDKTKGRYLFDIYGAAKNVVLKNCVFNNIAESQLGLCIEIRSIDGKIENITVDNVDVIHSGGDEAIAIFSNTADAENIVLNNINLKYVKNNIYDCNNLVTLFAYRDDAGYLNNVVLSNIKVEAYLAGTIIFQSMNDNRVKNVNLENITIIVPEVNTQASSLAIIKGHYNINNCYIRVEDGIAESYVFSGSSNYVYNSTIIAYKGRICDFDTNLNNCLIELYDTARLFGYGGGNLNNCTVKSHEDTNSLVGTTTQGTTKICNSKFISDNVTKLNIQSSEIGTLYNNSFDKVNVYFSPNTYGICKNNSFINCTIEPYIAEIFSEYADKSPYIHKLYGTLDTTPQSPIIGYKYFATDKGLPCYWNGSAWVDASGGIDIDIHTVLVYRKYYASNSFWRDGKIDGTQSKIDLTPIPSTGRYVVLSVKANDAIYVKAYGNQYANAAYILTDENLNKLSRSDGDVDDIITASQDGFLIVQTYSTMANESYIEGNIRLLCSFENIASLLNDKCGSGGTRPTLNINNKGAMFFDSTLGKPIWWTGTAWVDATGATV